MIFKAHDFDGEGNVSDTQAMFGCLEYIETRRLLTGAQLEFSKILGPVHILPKGTQNVWKMSNNSLRNLILSTLSPS